MKSVGNEVCRAIFKRALSSLAPGILSLALLSGCQPKELTSAKIYLRNNDWNRAVEQLEQAVKLYPNNPEAHFLLGQAYGNNGRYKEMVSEFDISLKLSNKFLPQISAERERHWVYKYNAAIVALDKDDYKAAEELLISAVLIDNSKHEAHKKLAATYLLTGQVEKSLAIYDRLLQIYPDDLSLLTSQANIYYGGERYQEAIAILKRILQIEPAHRDALANLALSYDALGNQTEAARAFEMAMQANPQDVDLMFLFGEHHYRSGNYDRAVQLFEQVLDRHPQDFDAAANIGNAYLSMAEKLREKLQSATNGASLPDEIQQLKNDAIANYKKSIPYLEKALALRPDQINLWRNLGVAYVNSGSKKRGEEAFLKAEELKLNSSK
jgi:tetratricopeptide (TPR) repeat protein